MSDIWATMSGQPWLPTIGTLVAALVAALGIRASNRWDSRQRKAATEELDLAMKIRQVPGMQSLLAVDLADRFENSALSRSRLLLSSGLRVTMRIAYAILTGMSLAVLLSAVVILFPATPAAMVPGASSLQALTALWAALAIGMVMISVTLISFLFFLKRSFPPDISTLQSKAKKRRVRRSKDRRPPTIVDVRTRNADESSQNNSPLDPV